MNPRIGLNRIVLTDAEQASGFLYEIVADRITAQIESGELRPNCPLPAENDMAYQYGVSLGTARNATRLLRQRGLVVTVRSKGNYVLDRRRRHEALGADAWTEWTDDQGRDRCGLIVEGVDRAGNQIPVIVEPLDTANGRRIGICLGRHADPILLPEDDDKAAHTLSALIANLQTARRELRKISIDEIRSRRSQKG